jgi:hypothetical protein
MTKMRCVSRFSYVPVRVWELPLLSAWLSGLVQTGGLLAAGASVPSLAPGPFPYA